MVYAETPMYRSEWQVKFIATVNYGYMVKDDTAFHNESFV